MGVIIDVGAGSAGEGAALMADPDEAEATVTTGAGEAA